MGIKENMEPNSTHDQANFGPGKRSDGLTTFDNGDRAQETEWAESVRDHHVFVILYHG